MSHLVPQLAINRHTTNPPLDNVLQSLDEDQHNKVLRLIPFHASALLPILNNSSPSTEKDKPQEQLQMIFILESFYLHNSALPFLFFWSQTTGLSITTKTERLKRGSSIPPEKHC